MQVVKQNPDTRRTGQTTVTTTAAPVLQIGAASGAGTTFTVRTGVDGAAWDLSNMIVGDVAVTSDGCAGLITAVNNGTNTISVAHGWYCPPGWSANVNAEANVPADGSTITIFRRSHCRLLGIHADPDNTANISIGTYGDAVTGDYDLEAGNDVTLVPEPPDKFLDLTQVYAIAASGSQSISWGIGMIPAMGGGAGGAVPAHTHLLAAGATDVTAIPAEVNLLDLGGMNVGDALRATGAASAAWSGITPLNWIAFAAGDLTPDVSAGTYFVTANIAPTSITDFDGATNVLIRVLAEDANTTIVHDATKISLQGGINFTLSAGDVLTFVERSGVWYEVGIR